MLRNIAKYVWAGRLQRWGENYSEFAAWEKDLIRGRYPHYNWHLVGDDDEPLDGWESLWTS